MFGLVFSLFQYLPKIAWSICCTFDIRVGPPKSLSSSNCTILIPPCILKGFPSIIIIAVIIITLDDNLSRFILQISLITSRVVPMGLKQPVESTPRCPLVKLLPATRQKCISFSVFLNASLTIESDTFHLYCLMFSSVTFVRSISRCVPLKVHPQRLRQLLMINAKAKRREHGGQRKFTGRKSSWLSMFVKEKKNANNRCDHLARPDRNFLVTAGLQDVIL